MDKLHPYNELRKRYDHIQDRFIDLFREMLAEIEAKDEEIAALKSSIEPACSIADSELVERAVRNARNHNPCPTMPRWHAVKKMFACGSTEAGNLCRRFGLDPDEELPTTWERR